MKQLMIKKFISILVISMISTWAFAYDIAVENADGKTIYYDYVQGNRVSLRVTYQSRGADWTFYSGDIIIPDTVIYKNHAYEVTSIGSDAFYRQKNVTSITIPNSVKRIGDAAFRDCVGLVSVTIGNSVTSIGQGAFSHCNALASIVFPNSMTFIGESAFNGCSALTSIVIPSSISTIAQNAFYGCNAMASVHISDVAAWCNISFENNSSNPLYYAGHLYLNDEEIIDLIIPNGVTSIGEYAFEKCSNITSLTIPTSVTSISEHSFWRCDNLGKIIVPVTDYSAFCNNRVVELINRYLNKPIILIDGEGKVIKDFIIPDNVKTIGRWAFAYCNSLVSIFIPNSVTTIDHYAFYECNALSSLTIPDGVFSIGNHAFSGCSNLKEVYSDISNPFNIEENVFSEISSEAILYIPTGTKENYKAYTGWTKYFKEIIEGTTSASYYTLSIEALGNGSVSFDGTTIRSGTSTFNVNEGSSVTIMLTPDEGYRVKSLTINNTDLTSGISNNKYTISNIKANTNVEAVFEAIPPTTYNLSINATGNGSVSYGEASVKGKTSTFTVNEGTSVTISLTPDNGYRVKSLTVNNTDVTSNVSNNQYTISNINANTYVIAEFEAIPPTTYTLSIKASGNGTVSYGNNSVKGKTSTFIVNEGTSVTITLTPDDGYRVKSLTVNNTDVTASIYDNQYTISSISANTTVEAEFEAIPPTTYTLSIKATGNGSVSYGDNSVKGKTSTFTVNKGISVTITLTPNDGYRVKSLTVNSTDVTSSISNNQYTISSISANTTVEAEFEAIPPTTYTLSIKASGNGSVRYGYTSVKGKTSTFTVIEGTSVDLIIIPDDACILKSFVLNNTDITVNIVNNKYTISNINEDITVEVQFKEIETITYGGMEFKVSSIEQKEVLVSKGNYGLWIEVPETVSANNLTWTVTGFEDGAFESANELAAVIWNPQVKFKEKVNNPNLLLYVKAADYAPTEVKNVIVNGKAKNITLNDAASGNNFYCPQEFTAELITYEHNYSMKTGYSTCQGWETIVLPFDVTVVTNNIGTELVPHTQWTLGDSKRPFWLCSMNEDGWKDESAIKANTPYIISMPNNDNYDATYNISGNIVFSASNVTVQASNNLVSSKHGHRNLVPNYQNIDRSSDIYALNVNNLWSTNTDSNLAEGSAFVRDSRQVRPFEAYMTIDSGGGSTRSISIFDDDDVTGIMDLPLASKNKDGVIRVYSLSGILLKQGKDEKILNDLPKGAYIVNGKKIIK